MSSLLLVIKTLVMLAGTPCYLLQPAGETRGAVVVLHDHGAYYTLGKEKSCSPMEPRKGLGWKGDTWVERLYDGIYVADSLAEQGYIVVVPDAPGWGGNLQECGEDEWAEQIIRTDRAVYRTLRDSVLPEPMPIYVTGFSMGCYRSWMLAAAETDVAGCAGFHWMQSTPNKGDWCVRGDYPAIAATIAPRPFLLVMGTRDRLFPVADSRICAETIGDAYRRSETPEATHNWTYIEREDDHHFGYDAYKILIEWINNL